MIEKSNEPSSARHAESPFRVFDLHLDSILQNRLFGYRIDRRHRAGIRGQPLFWHADLPRMREAHYLGACMGIHYWPVERDAGWREACRQLDVLDELCGLENVAKIGRDVAWSDVATYGGLALTAGVEGAHVLNGELERVGELARRRVAYLTLTHFSRNAAATPSLGRGTDENRGLTGFGRELVAECERRRVALDVAHVNKRGLLDVCKQATRPVLCTHTGVCGVHPHARNLSDDEIDAIAGTGGVIGVLVGPIFLGGGFSATTARVLDHVEYVADRVGIEHVAIGTDLDGWMPSIASDMRDCRDVLRIDDQLIARGYSDAQRAKISHGNALRVLAEIQSGVGD